MSQLFRIALPGIVALCWLVSSVQAQVGPPPLPGTAPTSTTGFASAGFRTQQIVDSLQRLTQPGYYQALFAAKSQPTPAPNARVATDVCDTYLCKSPAPTKTAPISTTNDDQSVLAGTPFSYTVNAFTDAETPNSLTYAASFSLANGLSFDPATRVISGTPNPYGPISVTITATDPGGLSATTSFIIDVSPRLGSGSPGPGLSLTLTATPTTLLTTETTSLSAIVSGGTTGSPYSYTFSGPGTILPSGNTATVSGLPAGVQTFTVVAASANRTVTGVVSVTVSAPVTVAGLRVLHQDGDNGQLTNNAIKPNLQLVNDGSSPVDYGQLTLRYWLTVENFAPMTNLSVYYAQLGTNRVKMKYVSLDKPRQGALGYVEYSFNGNPGNLAPGANSGPIQTGIAKQDYTNVNEADDYSYASNSSYAANTHITAYLDGKLVWGTEPAEVAPVQQLKAYTENHSSGANTISTYLQVRNEGNLPVDYKDLRVRYYFTREGNQPLNVYLDYAVLGTNKVSGQFVRLNPALNQADTYLELSFSPSLGTFNPISSTGNIQYRIAKQDWSDFDQRNDYSYQNGTNPLAENNRVVIYLGEQRVWGQEPTAGARLAAEETRTPLSVRVLGNPVTGSVIDLDIRGAENQPLRLQLTDITGRLVSERLVERAGTVERQQLPIGQQPAGMLLLRVSTPGQSQTVKVLKAD